MKQSNRSGSKDYSPKRAINFNNFAFAVKQNEKQINEKFQSSWSKYNLKQFKKAPLFMTKLKPCFTDSIKIIIHHSAKDIATVDNRNMALGLMKLRGGP